MRRGFLQRRHGYAAVALACILAVGSAWADDKEDLDIALGLSGMLRAARTVIAENQGRINDPDIGDKGLTGEAVLAKAISNFTEATGIKPNEVDAESRFGRLLQAQMAAVRTVMDENQGTINRAGVGFKGFVPAVFGRLVNEEFQNLVGTEARIKVTAPKRFVRNRKALPDKWELAAIDERLTSPQWEKGAIYSAEAMERGRKAYRVLVPEYYSEGCLACHGTPKGENDITGYPKEGGALGDLGGVISITLYR
jgi:hypothetical protein